jgi:sulfane dehydrogenase subunit SoxC
METKQSSRRELLKGGALVVGAAAAGAAATRALAQTPGPGAALNFANNEAPQVPTPPDILAYGARSKYIKTVRIQEAEKAASVTARYDEFGLTLHIYSPIGDQIGSMAPNSLHYFATTKGTFVPDIDPATHTLLLDGFVDRPRTYTLADLKRLPSVSRFHFIECSANNHNATYKTVQASHGAHSNAEWTGVLLSTLLKEAGVQPQGQWVIHEGAENEKGANTIPMNKAMDDVIIAYGMSGEPVRPNNGFPLRAVIPGYEGIFNTKWLRHIKVVDQYQLNMNDFGHLRQDAVGAALNMQWGPKSVILNPSGAMKLPGAGWYEITGLAWSGRGKVAKVEVSTDAGKTWQVADLKNTPNPKSDVRFGLMWNWDGNDHLIMSRTTDDQGLTQPTRQQQAKALGLPYTDQYAFSGLNNSIMAWQVAKDGSVTNGYGAISDIT